MRVSTVPSSSRPFRRVRLCWAAALTVLFGALCSLVVARWAPLLELDLGVDTTLHAVVRSHRGWLGVAVVTTDAGSPVSVDVVTALVAVGLLASSSARMAGCLVMARVGELGAETAVKDLVARPRPALPDPVASASGASFPSGHAAGTAVLVVFLLVVGLPLVTPNLCLPLVGLGGLVIGAVGLSRVLLGVHYPSDVIGGAVLGTACALAAACLVPGPVARSTRGQNLPSAHR